MSLYFLVGLIFWILRGHVQLEKASVLPSLGGTFTRPGAINDRGQVVGRYHLFIWDREKGMKDVGPMDLDDFDINNRGCIVGVIRSESHGNELGVLLEPIADRWEK